MHDKAQLSNFFRTKQRCVDKTSTIWQSKVICWGDIECLWCQMRVVHRRSQEIIAGVWPVTYMSLEEKVTTSMAMQKLQKLNIEKNCSSVLAIWVTSSSMDPGLSIWSHQIGNEKVTVWNYGGKLMQGGNEMVEFHVDTWTMPITKCPNKGENMKILKKAKAICAGITHTAFCKLPSSSDDQQIIRNLPNYTNGDRKPCDRL